MRRHPALAELSRDHHHALVVAQRLKRAGDAEAAAARAGFLAYWRADGQRHFREEEEILLPSCAEFIEPDHPVIGRVLTDHVRIRHLADRVSGGDSVSLELLHRLGEQLERHVRLEERELFPMIERVLPEADLRRLAGMLSS